MRGDRGRGGEERRRTGAIRFLPSSFLPPLPLPRRRRLSARADRASRVAAPVRSARACVPEELDVSGDDGMDAGGEKCGDAAAAAPGEAGSDLYAVLGLKKECSDAELKVAYRKLAMVSNWIRPVSQRLSVIGCCCLLHVVLDLAIELCACPVGVAVTCRERKRSSLVIWSFTKIDWRRSSYLIYPILLPIFLCR